MAELMLKVGAGANYEDGDVLCAFNRRRIRCVHAHHLCHVRQSPRNSDGLIRVDAVAKDWFEATHQYRFERVSPTEIDRVTIATGVAERLTGPEWNVTLAGQTYYVAFQENESGDPAYATVAAAQRRAVAAGENLQSSVFSVLVTDVTNHRAISVLMVNGVGEPATADLVSPEAMYVKEFVRRRRERDDHCLFGAPGAEFWYGGKKDFSNAKMDLVWRAIEAKTSYVESDPLFQLWPAGQGDLKHHLVVPVVEFSDVEAEVLVSPWLDETDPENPIVVKKRNIKANWRTPDVLDRLAVAEADVDDRRKVIDKRKGIVPLSDVLLLHNKQMKRPGKRLV